MIRNCERSFLLLLILITLLTVVNAQTPTPQGTPSPQSYLPTSAVTWLYAAGALASALASVIAWLAKIRWGQELEAVYKERITNLQDEKAGLEKNKDVTINVLTNQVEHLKIIQAEVMKARDERLDALRETKEAQLKSKEDEIATLLKSKEGEIATWKAFTSEDFMKAIKTRTEIFQETIEELNKKIENLQQQVRDRPLDAAQSALEIEKLKLEQNYLALRQAYEMKVSSQRFSDKAVSGEDEGKIQSARSFLDRLGATEVGVSQATTEEETHAEHRDADGPSWEATTDTEELAGKAK